MSKLFFVRIDIVELMDFATDPDGENMSLLTFAKELKKEKSEFIKIQRIINEANCYINQKKEAGKKSAALRAKKALEDNKKKSNGVATALNGVATEVNGPSTNNRSSNNNKEHTIQGEDSIIDGGIICLADGTYVNTETGEKTESPF